MRGHKGGRGRGAWGMGEWEGHRGRFGGGRGGRFFDHGDLRHVVLALLAEQPRHGYDIIRAIEERTGGAYAPSPGVIYPTLQLLQDIGHAVAASGGGGRNRYEITSAGRAFIDQNTERISDILARMAQAGRSRASPIIMAAMDNLKSALRGSAAPWSETEAREAAAAIDAAAERIRALRGSTSATLDHSTNIHNGDKKMLHSVARIESERASIYLQQLCKHFAHKIPVEFTPEQGQITFSSGICRLEAKDGVLTLKAEAEDADRLAQLQDVVERHLVRFAFREPQKIEWRAVDAV